MSAFTGGWYGGAMSGWIPPRLRTLLGADLDEITPDSIQRLVGLPEDQDLEFKRQRYGSGESQSKEAATDIAALANMSGGLIVIGMEEVGDGIASRLIPETDTSDFRLWIHQVTAIRVFPSATVHIRTVSTGDGHVHILSIPPSIRKPHAVSVGGDAFRYPIRLGTTRRYLSEPEIADLYYKRIAGLTDVEARISALHEDARALSQTVEHAEAWSWLALSSIPSILGNQELDLDIARRWQEWVGPALQSFPSVDQRTVSLASVGFRSIELTDSHDMNLRLYSTHMKLGLDGSGVILHGYMPITSQYDASKFATVVDEEVVASVINCIGVLAHHAIAVGAIGDLMVGSQIFANRPILLCQIPSSMPRPGSQHPGQLYKTRAVDHASPVGMRSTPLESVAIPSPDVMALTRNVTSDLFSPFGQPQPLQISVDNQLILKHFQRNTHTSITRWADKSGVEVIGGA